MIVKVLLFKDASSNPDGLPTDWPAQVVQVKEGEKVAAPWVEMTKNEYESYRKRLQPKYDAWQAAYELKQKQIREMHEDMQELEDYARKLELCEKYRCDPASASSVKAVVAEMKNKA